MFGTRSDKKPQQPQIVIEDEHEHDQYQIGDAELIKNKRKRCIIYPDSSIKSYWNLVLTLLLLYTASYMPYGISFVDTTYYDLVVFEVCVDMLFIVDVFLNFFTAYEDNRLGIETRYHRIAATYLSTWFFPDILSR